MKRLFGTDGVRGLANVELTAQLALDLGRAVALYFAKKTDSAPVFYIGCDTRLSCKMLEAALAAGICSAGGVAHLLGVMPTPAVAYLTANSNACAGVVISASHNHFADNGIKFFSANGAKLPDSVEDEIQKIMQTPSTDNVTGEKLGTIVENNNLAEEYANYVTGNADVDLHGLKIVVDCANGAAHELAPLILRRLGAEVVVINDKPNGININDNCGSTHLEQLCQVVKEQKANVGIAHDGDADRCLMVDEYGIAIDGDQMMLICALELMRDKKLKKNTLVTTVMSNIGLHKAIEQCGGKCVVTGVGDRYVLEEMLKSDYNLGGEQSGHVIFGDLVKTGDGIVTATQVLRAMVKNNKPLSELAALMVRYPQVLKNVRVKNKHGWQQNDNIKKALESVEKQLEGNGRVLLRESGTEPLIRVMLEGKEITVLHRLTDYLVDVVQKELA